MISPCNEARGFSPSAGERWLALALRKVITCKCWRLSLPPECPTQSVSAGETELIVYSNNAAVSMVMNGGVLESARKGGGGGVGEAQRRSWTLVGASASRRRYGTCFSLKVTGGRELNAFVHLKISITPACSCVYYNQRCNGCCLMGFPGSECNYVPCRVSRRVIRYLFKKRNEKKKKLLTQSTLKYFSAGRSAVVGFTIPLSHYTSPCYTSLI